MYVIIFFSNTLRMFHLVIKISRRLRIFREMFVGSVYNLSVLMETKNFLLVCINYISHISHISYSRPLLEKIQGFEKYKDNAETRFRVSVFQTIMQSRVLEQFEVTWCYSAML